VAHATEETNIVITDSVATAYAMIDTTEARTEFIQNIITWYVAQLQELLIPDSAIGLKIMVEGGKIYIGQ
jgi:hypothetical protein